VFLRLLLNRSTEHSDLPKCYFFNTFFYAKLNGPRGYDFSQVSRWTKRSKVRPFLPLSSAVSHCLYCQTDIFAYDKVLLPVHLGVHWCLAVINIKERRTEYYDSLGGSNDTCHEVAVSSLLFVLSGCSLMF